MRSIRELDRIDKKILETLIENGRATLNELAEELRINPSKINKRKELLENENILEGYTAKVDPEKAGQGAAAFLNIDVKAGEAGHIAGTLTQCNGICEVHKTTGNHGLIAKIRAKNRGEISEFVEDRLSTYKGVKDVDITMTMETYKEDLIDI